MWIDPTVGQAACRTWHDLTCGPPELPGLVEQRQILASAHQDRPAGAAQVVAPPDIDMIERLDQIEHTTRIDRYTHLMQHSLESEQVLQKVACLTWCSIDHLSSA